VTIGLETCEYTVTEGESQNICASLDGSLQRPVDTHLSIGASSKRPNISEQSHLVYCTVNCFAETSESNLHTNIDIKPMQWIKH